MSEEIKDEQEGEAIVSEGVIVICIMLLTYISLGHMIEKYKLSFGHQASFTIIFGILISLVCYEQGQDGLVRAAKFSNNAFFYVCLPPIVFASGFNMKRGNFFANLKNILLFGILGTFVAFTSFSLMTIYLNDQGFMKEYLYDSKTGQWTINPLKLTHPECMLFCSLMCSSDVIAAVSLISYQQNPKLFSIVFGEGITNDAVSIILFNTVLKYTEGAEISSSTPLAIAKDFGNLGCQSLFIGLIFGLLSSYILKKFRAFSANAISEIMIIFGFGYLSYVVSEVAECSGIITLLTSGIVMAHYSWYNLSSQGRQSSYIVFQFLGESTEAFVFAYLGLTFFSYAEYKWSPELFLVELVVIVLGRFLGTIVLVKFVEMLGYRSEISLKELIFIWYAGMIRGAIAFGLVLRINEDKYYNSDVIVTTALSLVIFTTVVFGSTVGLLSKYLLKENENETQSDDQKQMEEEQKSFEQVVMGKDQNTQPLLNKSATTDSEGSLDCDTDSSYEQHLHPNEERYQGRRIHHGCDKYFHRFDELIMKPIFIYKYDRKQQKKSQQFFELFLKDGNQIEENFARQQKINQSDELSQQRENLLINNTIQMVDSDRQSMNISRHFSLHKDLKKKATLRKNQKARKNSNQN